MDYGSAIFIDSSVQLLRFIGNSAVKAQIDRTLSGYGFTATSLVVRQEFKRRFLTDVRYVRDALLKNNRDCGETLRYINRKLPANRRAESDATVDERAETAIQMHKQWREHPLRSLGRVALMNFWYWAEIPGAISLVDHPRLFVARWALLPFHWVRLCCAVAGVAVLLRSERWRRLWPALGVWAFFALAPAMLYPVPRYLAPACPMLDALAALGLFDALQRRARARARKVS